MKTTFTKIILSFFLLMIMGYSFAQSPDAFNYQAVARDASGNVLQTQLLGIKVSLLKGSESGAIVYSETFGPTTNEFGLFTLEIGKGAPVIGNFDTLAWGMNQYWLQVEMDPNGGATYTDMGTSKLLSVPYAMYANKTGELPTGTVGQTLLSNGTNWVANDRLYNNGTFIGIGTTSPSYLLDIQGASPYIRINTTGSWGGMILERPDSLSKIRLRFHTNGINKWAVGLLGTKDDFIISKNSNYSDTTFLISHTTGNVGIGIANPSDPLYVKHTVSTHSVSESPTITAEVTNGTYTMKAILAGQNGFQGVHGETNRPNGYGVQGLSTGGGGAGVNGIALGTTTSSNYGIKGNATGTSNFSYGVFGLADGGTGNYGIYGSGSTYGVFANGDMAYTGTLTDVSDAKFKKDISDYNGALENVLKLRPVSYTMNTEDFPFMGFKPEKEIGFIAQEIEIVFPELVKNGIHPGAKDTDKAIEYKGLNYIGMIPILVKAIQEQQIQIEQLKQEVKTLKEK